MIRKEIETGIGKKVTILIKGKNSRFQNSSPFKIGGVPGGEESLLIKKDISNETGISEKNIYILKQVHGTTFFNSDDIDPEGNLQEGDALYTLKSGNALVIKTADCIPLFFWSKKGSVVGVIHSGWKGANSGITERVLEKIISLGFNSEDLFAYFGPCIRQKNYEVKEDVASLFQIKSPESVIPFQDRFKLGLDLYLKKVLLDRNIKFEDSEICTREDNNYYSHRRGDTRRNLNVIWMD